MTLERLAAALSDRYRLERELGQGGMATVYLAQDLKHDRQVAIKVLKPELAAVLGAERFVVEIKTTAALQHPHILPLFDSGTADGFLFYVMPFIDGETLRSRLDRETQLGVEESVRIASDVASALHYAHQHGVIHRDIKPENILLHDGRPMVADFGIALAVSAAAGGRMTETGLSLGTPHYMSPEQATAEKEISARSDIYSLGSVTYEMLTGEPPHMGNSAQQIIMKIITEEAAPVTRLRKAVPANVAAAVAKALEKLPADRFETARAFAEALGNRHFTRPADGRVGALSAARRGVPVPLAAGGMGVLALLAWGGWQRGPETPEAQPVRFAIPVPAGGVVASLDVSADGSRVLFSDVTAHASYLRMLADDSLRQITAPGVRLRFAPDGQSTVGPTQGLELVVTALQGGASRTLGKLNPLDEAIWGNDGYIYFELGGGLARMPAEGGQVDTLIVGDSSGVYHRPHDVLPGGRGVVVSRGEGRTRPGRAVLVDPERRTVTDLFPVSGIGAKVRFSATGHLIYADGNRLVARSFDPDRRVVGDDVMTLIESPEGHSLSFGFGGTTLAYTSDANRAVGIGTAMIVDRRGTRRELPNLPPGDYGTPWVSPDGRRLAMTRVAPEAAASNVWVYEMPAGPLSPLTRTGDVRNVGWSADGGFVGYSRGFDLLWRRFDGATEEELLLHRDRMLASFTFTPDGRQVVFQESPGSWDIGIATLGAPGSDSLLLRGDYWEGNPAVSPDSRWLAYYSTEGGQPQIYVRPLSGAGRRTQVSLNGGLNPRWSRDGLRLFFVQGGILVEASLAIGTEVSVTGVRPLFVVLNRQYDVFPGDSLFAVSMPVDGSAGRASDILVIANYDVLLRRLAAPGRR